MQGQYFTFQLNVYFLNLKILGFPHINEPEIFKRFNYQVLIMKDFKEIVWMRMIADWLLFNEILNWVFKINASLVFVLDVSMVVVVAIIVVMLVGSAIVCLSQGLSQNNREIVFR